MTHKSCLRLIVVRVPDNDAGILRRRSSLHLVMCVPGNAGDGLCVMMECQPCCVLHSIKSNLVQCARHQALRISGPGERHHRTWMGKIVQHLSGRRPDQYMRIVRSARQHGTIGGPANGAYGLLMIIEGKNRLGSGRKGGLLGSLRGLRFRSSSRLRRKSCLFDGISVERARCVRVISGVAQASATDAQHSTTKQYKSAPRPPAIFLLSQRQSARGMAGIEWRERRKSLRISDSHSRVQHWIGLNAATLYRRRPAATQRHIRIQRQPCPRSHTGSNQRRIRGQDSSAGRVSEHIDQLFAKRVRLRQLQLLNQRRDERPHWRVGNDLYRTHRARGVLFYQNFELLHTSSPYPFLNYLQVYHDDSSSLSPIRKMGYQRAAITRYNIHGYLFTVPLQEGSLLCESA